MRERFFELLESMPLIAVLRGLEPQAAVPIGAALIDAGLVALEVPMNSPQPIESIRSLQDAFGRQVLIGAGTVMGEDHVDRVAGAGGQFIVSPHMDARVITAAQRHGFAVMPGVTTPSEGFAALAAGADALKLFPAEMLTPAVVRAWRSVLAPEVWLIPTGGITTERMGAYWRAGANGFAIGSALFRPEYPVDRVRANARRFVNAFEAILETPHSD